MTKYILPIVSVLALALWGNVAAAGSTTGKGANPNGKPFVEIQGQIVEVEGEISSLQDQVDALIGRVDTIEEKVEANAGAIAALQAQSADLQAQIDANADDILSLQLQVDDLEAANADLQAQIDDLGDADGALQAQIDANSAMITTLNQTISDLGINLQSQIDNNTALIGVLQSEIDLLEEHLAMKQNMVDGFCPDGSAIRQILGDGNVVCAEVGGGEPGTLESISVVKEEGIGRFGNQKAYAECPSGYTLTGGGYQTAWCVSVFASRQDENHWYVHGESACPYNTSVYSYAVCSRILPPE